MENGLTAKIISGLKTVEKWESEDLLVACRKEIPFHEVCPEQFYLPPITNDEEDKRITIASPFAKPDDHKYQGDDLLLKRMTVYFQSIMTWVNNPPCELCGFDGTKLKTTRGPITQEERDGEASRVEVYFCPRCNAETTTFPRYNNPKKLLETKKGRCGEYANLYGAFCRSAGFETRYVMDFTDHVWVEVWSNETNRWIMADGCEGKIDEPSMYEKGWGKNLCYNLAFTIDSVTDVTMRYTRKFHSGDFQARRRQFSASEEQSNMIVAQQNGIVRSKKNLPKTRIDELDRRVRLEKQFLENTLKQDSWGAGAYSEGRLSGSLAWRISRGEAGNNDSNDNANATEITSSDVFHVECFHPAPYCSESCTILLSTPKSETQKFFPECITVMGTPCGAGLPQSISIVIVDEKHSCILQSRVFKSWNDASTFLLKIPDERIVAIYSDLNVTQANDDLKKCADRLGNLNLLTSNDECKGDEDYFLYVGQVNRKPDWARSQKASRGSNMEIILDLRTGTDMLGLKLQCQVNTTPNMICARLPDKYMPLQSQIQATEDQKIEVFNNFINEERKQKSSKYVGFTTKDGAPVYLMSKESFPFHKADHETEKSKWKTFHFVPEEMWHEEVKVENKTEVDVPVDSDFFSSLFGPNLLKMQNGVKSTIPTSAALSNTRLVALLFSAHWCPPCRKFTPVLCEMYEFLKNEFPTHGLEIVFVSRDHDEMSFDNYFRTMPWLSIPWNIQRELLAQRFAVQGIPSFVVLDSISGNVVVTKEQSRGEVMMASQQGEDAIKDLFEQNWLERVPPESKNMIEILKLSCMEDMDCSDEHISKPYLERSNAESQTSAVTKRIMSKEEQAARIKDLFTNYVAKGLPPNDAAAKAINEVASEAASLKEGQLQLNPGSLSGTYTDNVIVSSSIIPDITSLRDVLHTAKKYVENVQKKPYSPKFRSFKISNRIFDNITSADGGLEYIVKYLGFVIHTSPFDFMASIPLSADTDAMKERIDALLSPP